MTSTEKKREVFVIRIWRERRELQEIPPEWRGEIECIGSGERRYLKSLDEIIAFIAPYLEQMGVKIERQWAIPAWLVRWGKSSRQK